MSDIQGKRFLYLVQCEGDTLPYSTSLPSSRSDIIYLSWKIGNENMIYFPNSTWTEGRNRLWEEACRLNNRYDYYIFMDDDIVFEEGSFSYFEDLLLKYRPAIATPRLEQYNPYTEHITLETHTVFAFDAAINAFHQSVIFDDIIFPLIDKFDHVSWWDSQYICIRLAYLFYKNYVLQFNTVRVVNETHRSYPTNTLKWYQRAILRLLNLLGSELTQDYFIFRHVHQWIYQELFTNHPDVLASKKLSLKRYVYCHEPSPPKNSYQISPEFKKLYLRKQ